MNYTSPKKHRYFFVFAVLSIFGCSGGSSNPTSPDSSNGDNQNLEAIPVGTEISSETYSKINFTGTWKRHSLANSAKEVNLTVNGVDTRALETKAYESLDVIYVDQIDETSKLTKYCDSLPAKLVEGDPQNDIAASTNQPEDNRIKKYYKITDDHYRVDFYNNDKLDAYYELEKHSSLLEFDFGMFSFSMTNNTALDASQDVCGSVKRLTSTLTDTQDDDITFDSTSNYVNSYLVSAPYESSFIALNFIFTGAIKEATYDVVQGAPDTPSEIKVEISSPEFNAPPSSPDTTTAINGSTGVVTIGSISDTSVRGDYDITLENGEILVGNFSFDLN